MTDSTALRQRLRSEGLDPAAWSNGPGTRYAAHRHRYDKSIVVSAGSITFGLHDQELAIELGPGDRLDLPAELDHHARVGPDGVICLEAHLPAGSLEAVAKRRTAGTW